LAGEITPPDWPPLTTAELAPVLARYPRLGPVQSVTWHSPRPFAASGLVACAHRTVFVKRHSPSQRRAADLAEEHAFIHHLRQAGAPVPQILSTTDGRTAVETAAGTYEVHALAPGHDLYRDAVSWSPFTHPAHARATGRALAMLHEAAAGYAAPPRATGLLVADFRAFAAADPLAALRVRLAREPLLAAALADRPWQADFTRVLLPWHALLATHLPALTPLWTHNDAHASNLLWEGQGPTARVSCVLDFGLANRTSAAFDLATAIERNCVEWLRLAVGACDIAHADLAVALISGYCDTAPLPAGQAAALPHLLPLVHVEFALSELAYFHGVLGDAAKADLAYHDFLLGHATWFSTSDGQDFLHAIHVAAG
jgi:Ser/Thr protein kinase RdoA (MazF antagonist)